MTLYNPYGPEHDRPIKIEWKLISFLCDKERILPKRLNAATMPSTTFREYRYAFGLFKWKSLFAFEKNKKRFKVMLAEITKNHWPHIAIPYDITHQNFYTMSNLKLNVVEIDCCGVIGNIHSGSGINIGDLDRFIRYNMERPRLVFLKGCLRTPFLKSRSSPHDIENMFIKNGLCSTFMNFGHSPPMHFWAATESKYKTDFVERFEDLRHSIKPASHAGWKAHETMRKNKELNKFGDAFLKLVKE